jgi:putative membrane protein
MNNKIRIAVAMSLGLLAAGTAYAQNLSKGDQRILTSLAQANVNEVAAGNIALQKATSPEVKSFAQKMVDDHTKGLQEVQQVAQAKNVTLPTEPDAKHKKMADRLNALSGEEFDKTYIANAGVNDHKAAHKLVTDAQQKAKDPDIKALAAKLQPTIDQHMKSVPQMAAGKSGAPKTQ